jgi:hypothetical protein
MEEKRKGSSGGSANNCTANSSARRAGTTRRFLHKKFVSAKLSCYIHQESSCYNSSNCPVYTALGVKISSAVCYDQPYSFC